MNRKQFVTYFLWALIILGVIARIYQFGRVPSSLNRDEAALGYTAYALSVGGADEWGMRWPLIFKSFGDYKLPGYVYTLIPFVKMLGTDPWVIRLPSLVAGLCLIALMYVFSGYWTKHKTVRLLATALTALSPWAIFYSRMAFEANLGLCFLALALWLFLKPLSLKTFLAAGVYVLAMLTYNTPLLLAPILAAFLFGMSKQKRDGAVKAFVVLTLAACVALLLSPVLSQKSNITIFSDPTLGSAQRDAYVQSASVSNRLWNHQYTFVIRAATERFISSLSPDFLVLRGGQNPWHSVPGNGHVLWITYGIFLISLVFVRRPWLLLLLLGALLPAVVTVDAPHATRSLLFLWLLPLCAALLADHHRWSVGWIGGLAGVELVVFFMAYMSVMSGNLGSAWANGFTQSLSLVPREKTIIIRDGGGADIAAEQAYIFALLFERTSPQDFTHTVEYGPVDNAGLIRVHHFGRYWFSDPGQDVLNQAAVIERNTSGVYVLKP